MMTRVYSSTTRSVDSVTVNELVHARNRYLEKGRDPGPFDEGRLWYRRASFRLTAQSPQRRGIYAKMTERGHERSIPYLLMRSDDIPDCIFDVHPSDTDRWCLLTLGYDPIARNRRIVTSTYLDSSLVYVVGSFIPAPGDFFRMRGHRLDHPQVFPAHGLPVTRVQGAGGDRYVLSRHTLLDGLLYGWFGARIPRPTSEDYRGPTHALRVDINAGSRQMDNWSRSVEVDAWHPLREALAAWPVCYLPGKTPLGSELLSFIDAAVPELRASGTTVSRLSPRWGEGSVQVSGARAATELQSFRARLADGKVGVEGMRALMEGWSTATLANFATPAHPLYQRAHGAMRAWIAAARVQIDPALVYCGAVSEGDYGGTVSGIVLGNVGHFRAGAGIGIQGIHAGWTADLYAQGKIGDGRPRGRRRQAPTEGSTTRAEQHERRANNRLLDPNWDDF